MKLGKLMAVGKSLVSGRGSMAYRENKQAYLPKFGSPKNPFMPPPQSESPKAPAENPVAPVEKTSARVSAKPQNVPAAASSPKSLASWTAKLNPMTVLRGSEDDSKAFSPRVVQAELSLDSVKVVHNDLTDADVEIVPMKSRPEKMIADLPPAKKSWEILGERLMRATAL